MNVLNKNNDDTNGMTCAHDYDIGYKDGYDYGGARGPFYDTVLDKITNYDEAVLCTKPSLMKEHTTEILIQIQQQPVEPETATHQHQGDIILIIEAENDIFSIEIKLQKSRISRTKNIPESKMMILGTMVANVQV